MSSVTILVVGVVKISLDQIKKTRLFLEKQTYIRKYIPLRSSSRRGAVKGILTWKRFFDFIK